METINESLLDKNKSIYNAFREQDEVVDLIKSPDVTLGLINKKDNMKTYLASDVPTVHPVSLTSQSLSSYASAIISSSTENPVSIPPVTTLVTHQNPPPHRHQSEPDDQYQELHLPIPISILSLHNNQIKPTSVLDDNNGNVSSQQQPIEKLSRPMAFDKMEALVREMQDSENGVPVRQQKLFLTSIPYAFMGYDLIEWLMDRLIIEESEALNIANQLCLHGYFFPVNDTKTLTVKDDSSLYRFQTPYYWPWQHKAPDNVEYAIYLTKRSLRNKQRHALEDYEAEALQSLHKNLKGKWDFISMQAEEQVRLAKERKKGDKIVGDSQERAYWRVHRPPPGQFTPLEPCPIPSRDRQGSRTNKKKTNKDIQREVDYLKKSLCRTRMKMSQACESLVAYSETFMEYDFILQPVLPSNPWITEDTTFWQLNNNFVDIPTEKRVRRWAISIEELVCDPTGLQEFTSFLEKEYSHENIRFWIAVNRLRRSAHSQVSRKVNDIYEEFLKPGAPCEINIDGKTMDSVLKGLKNPSRFTFDSASEHIYMLLLKKDCYPRFIRSDHYKRLLETGIQPSHKKRFFNFSAVSGAKKKMTAALSNQAVDGNTSMTSKTGVVSMGISMITTPPTGNLARRRGSDRSLSGSAHELTVIGVNKDASTKVPHSHSQSNLNEISFRETVKLKNVHLEPPVEHLVSSICPWDEHEEPAKPVEISEPVKVQVHLELCGFADKQENKYSSEKINADETEIERSQRNMTIRHQHTLDGGETNVKMLTLNINEQRRASLSFIPSQETGNNIRSVKTSSPVLLNESLKGKSPETLVTKNTKSPIEFEVDKELINSKNENEMELSFKLPQLELPKKAKKLTPSLNNQSLHTSQDNESQNPYHELHTIDQPDQSHVNSSSDIPQVVQIQLIDNSKLKENINDTAEETTSIPILENAMHASFSKAANMNTIQETKEIENKLEENKCISPQEELSPTTEEYQETSQYGKNCEDIIDFEIAEEKVPAGCLPPTSTPASSLAPLAELDVDSVEDDIMDEVYTRCTATTPNVETDIATKETNTICDDSKIRRKKRKSLKKRTENLNDNEKNANTTDSVCPWEDENSSSSSGTFVKTYATLGYL